jgi:hypothetical protein
MRCTEAHGFTMPPEEAGPLRTDRLGQSSRGHAFGGQPDKAEGRTADKARSPDGGRERDSGVFSIDEELCVWMKASVINFKLCDKTYDCLNCAFDKAMSEAWSVKPPGGDE